MENRSEIRAARERFREATETNGEIPGSLCDLFAATDGMGDYAYAAARLRELGPEGARSCGWKPVRAYIARSVTVEPLLPHLTVHAALGGIWLEIVLGGYGSFIDDLMNPQGVLCAAAPDLVLFISDVEDLAGGLADICASGDPEAIERETHRAIAGVTSLLEVFRRHSPARLVVQGLLPPEEPALGEVADANHPAGELRAVRRINDALAAACRAIGDAVLFDQEQAAARSGRAVWRDARLFHSSRVAVAPRCFRPYAAGLVRALRSLYFPSRKVLCTDLDGTLWGGIVGEDGSAGVATGAAFPGSGFRAYQRHLKQLAARGVLLAVVSKNNPADVEECFRLRAGDLALRLDNFAGRKIGWQEKCDSLVELARELSLGLDSFVFVDDSPVECAAVRQRLPQVLVIEAPRGQPWLLPGILSATGAFDTLAITEDDRRRTDEYRARAQRAELEKTAASREQFLQSLEMECRVVGALEAPLSRAAQLISKTNQFNLTTRRHSAGDIERLSAAPGSIAVAVRVKDRFGDAGVTGIALCRAEGECCSIDTFLLSCRVIGRGVETALLAYLACKARAAGLRRLIGEYIPTAKNQLCREFLPSHGFQRIAEEQERVLYALDLTGALPEVPYWIKLVEGNAK